MLRKRSNSQNAAFPSVRGREREGEENTAKSREKEIGKVMKKHRKKFRKREKRT